MIKFLAAILFSVLFASSASADSYMGLEPGVSIKRDADKVFGQPVREVIKGRIYDYSPEGHDAGRLAVTFAEATQVIERIDIYLLSPYPKAKLKEWFGLGDPSRRAIDIKDGNLIEYYAAKGINLNFIGPTEASMVTSFSHVKAQARKVGSKSQEPRRTQKPPVKPKKQTKITKKFSQAEPVKPSKQLKTTRKIPTNAAPRKKKLKRVKKAGSQVLLSDDFNSENKGKGAFNFTAFENWEITKGSVDLIGNGFYDYYPPRGLYLDLDGTTSKAGKLVSKQVFNLVPGHYRLRFELAGNPLRGPDKVTVSLGGLFKEQFVLERKAPFRTIKRTIIVTSTVSARLSFEHAGGDNHGVLVDNVSLRSLDTAVPSSVSRKKQKTRKRKALKGTIQGGVCWTEGPTQFADATHYCVSSVLPPKGRWSYGPKNLVGYFGRVGAWCEGVAGPGIGETITIRIAGGPAFRRLMIRNGYGKSTRSFLRNGRIKMLRVTTDTGVDATVRLIDQPNDQPIQLPLVAPHRRVRLKILDIYPGTRYADTCVSSVGPDFVHEEELLQRGQASPPDGFAVPPLRAQAKEETHSDGTEPSDEAMSVPVEEEPSTTLDDKSTQPSQIAKEIVFWNEVKDSSDPEAFEAYLRQYPEGAFTELARLRIKKLRQQVGKELERDAQNTLRSSDRHARAPVHKCDRYAAHPENPDSLVAGTYGNTIRMHANETVAACKQAVKQYPNEKRLRFQLARSHLFSGHPEKSTPVFEKLASMGYPAAITSLGLQYCSGRGVPKDDAQCASLLATAKDQGHAFAIAQLGFLYLKGRGVPKDKGKAFQMFKQAADLGSASGMWRLSEQYEKGDGIAVDDDQAVRWLRSAAENSHRKAKFLLALRHKDGRGVRRSRSAEFRLMREAAELGYVYAYLYLAATHVAGDGVAVDNLKAVDFVIKALKSGNKDAVDFVLAPNVKGFNWTPEFRKALKQSLTEHGVYTGTIDGKFGPDTIRALNALSAG